MSLTSNNFNLDLHNHPILSLNCNSLSSYRKRNAVTSLVLDARARIVLLQETRVTGVHPQIAHLRAYTSLAPGSVGTSVLVAPEIRATLCPIVVPDVEGTFVEIAAPSGPLIVGSVYLKCGLSAARVGNAISALLSALSGYRSLFLGGDFNCNTASYPLAAKANAFLASAASAGVSVISPLDPTFRTGSVIDHFLCRLPPGPHPSLAARTTDTVSDHFGICLSTTGKYSLVLESTPPRPIMNYSGVNWERFNNYVEDLLSASPPPKLSSPSKIDSAVADFSSALSRAIDLFLKSKVVPPVPINNLPRNVRELFHTRSQLIKCKYREKRRVIVRQGVLAILEEELKAAEESLDALLKEHYSRNLCSALSNITPGPGLFKQVKRFANRKPSTTVHAIRDSDGELRTSGSGIAGVFCDYYKDLYRARRHRLPLSPQVAHAPQPKPPGLVKFLQIIRALRNKKSAGLDKISNFVIRKLSLSNLLPLFNIIKACINLSHFPQAWKEARIFVLPKSNNSRDPAKFRPISMVSNLGKVLERCLLERLVRQTARLKVLPGYQTGFRASHSTLDAAAVLRDMVVRASAWKKVSAVCFLDVKKAFDSVWSGGLVWKMREFGYDESLVRIVESFLTGRTARVGIGSAESPSFRVERGVPQGTVWGPILYNIFVSDQPSPDQNSGIIQYADDTVCLGFSKSPALAVNYLSTYAEKIAAHLKKWGLEINGEKSQFMLFENAHWTKARAISLPFWGSTLKSLPGVCYLGIWMDPCLNSSKTADKRRKLAWHATMRLKHLLSSDFLDERVKIILYKALIRPIVAYGSPLWYDCSEAMWSSVSAVENKALRIIFNMGYNLISGRMPSHEQLMERYADVGLKTWIKARNRKFVHNYKHHKNKWIREEAISDAVKRTAKSLTRISALPSDSE